MIENFDNKNIQSFEYETSINSDGNIVGTCELGNATIQMLNDSNEYSSLKGQWIKTIHGSFYIHSVEPVQEKVNIKLSCYDIKYKLDTPYDNSLYIWPMTLKEWRNAIFKNCDVSYDNADFPNSDLVIEKEPYIGDNPSNRTVISIIAQAGCSWVDTDKDDIFYFNWFDNTIHIVNDWIELTTEKEMSSPINVVVLGRGDVEDNVKWPETLPENPVEFRIDNNYILDPQESEEDKRYDVIETIYNRVNGFKYLIFNIRTQNIFKKLSIKLGQIITYRDMWGNVLSANIMSKKITYLGGKIEDDDNYEITLSAEEIKETSTEYSYASSIENKLRKTEIAVDKQNQRIDAVVSDVNTNKEKVASLEITTGNISTKVSSVETDLSTTNSNLSNLSGKVDTISNDIDGVSADFEDFKDNEYIQSIDNLQKQIDGAIQFWNGAEIPTINNYPANQWTTENDKINHQADIYTVVQDVQGEMKQGKSYRFDKVGGVWQWIELTDNELSAVQAIAQEALNKANANATEIGTVKTRVSSLEQTDEQIKASVESIDKQIIPTASVTGSDIYVEDSSNNPLIQLEIEGKSEQETSSQNANLFDEDYYNNESIYEIGVYKSTLAKFKGNKLLYIKAELKSGKTAQSGLYVCLSSTINPNISGSKFGWFINNGEPYKISCDFADYTDLYFDFYPTSIDLSVIFDNYNLWVSTNNIDYIPFIPDSPSPDYPSEIKSVGYENLFAGADWRKVITSSGYPIYANSTNVIINSSDSNNINFNITGSYNGIESNFIPVKSNESYFLSFEGNNLNINRLFITQYDESKTRISTLNYNNVTIIDDTIFTTTNDGYITVSFASTVALTETIDITDIQLTKGTQQHSYIPYGKYGIEVETVGKNLFDKDNFTYELNYYNDAGEEQYSLATGKTLMKIPVESNSDYVIDGFSIMTYQNQGTVSRIYYFDENKQFISRSSLIANSSVFRFTTPINCKYIDFQITVKTDSDTVNKKFLDDVDTFKLEKGLVETEYEPYQKNPLLIILNEPLRSLPSGVKDLLYIKNNKLYVDRYVGSMVLDGSENWAVSTQDDYYDFYIFNKSISNMKIMEHYKMCNYFKYEYKGFRDASIPSLCENTLGVANKLVLFKTDGSQGTTVDEWILWLSEHPTQVDYELATPLTEELGEIQIPSTFKGVTHITTTNDLEPTLNIEYVRDTTLSSYVEGQVANAVAIQERKNAEFQIQADEIKAGVSETQSSLDGAISSMNKLESSLTSQSATLEIISKNIDKTTGEVREVTTTTGFTFNAEGSSIKDSEGYEILQTPKGAYYKDGDKITGQYTKDGSKQKDLELFGTYSYGKENIDDTPMFIAQLYTDENGEQCFGHFYNGGDY